MATTQYIQIWLELFQPSSPKVKKVVLKSAYEFPVSNFSPWGFSGRTETKVAGRKIIVSSAMDFIILLSCWEVKLYACNRNLVSFSSKSNEVKTTERD